MPPVTLPVAPERQLYKLDTTPFTFNIPDDVHKFVIYLNPGHLACYKDQLADSLNNMVQSGLSSNVWKTANTVLAYCIVPSICFGTMIFQSSDRYETFLHPIERAEIHVWFTTK